MPMPVPALAVRVFHGQHTTLRDTIETFARARVVVGAHGAALTNAMFCPPGAGVVEIGMPGPCCRM
jgi:capsular polysaccharide biosynthesis protein